MEEQMYKNILVGVDGSDQANLAYERAIEVARSKRKLSHCCKYFRKSSVYNDGVFDVK